MLDLSSVAFISLPYGLYGVREAFCTLEPRMALSLLARKSSPCTVISGPVYSSAPAWAARYSP